MHQLIDLSNFESEKIRINIPSQNEDGQFSKLTYNGLPIIIQTPISSTKQGVVKMGKKLVCDLMFKSIETEFLHWFEELETSVHKLLSSKSEEWFEQKLELVDVENVFTAPTKIYKSGKYYLIRASLKELKVFKENDNILELTYSDISHESNIISIIEVKGIKYTNKDFQFDIEMKQVMIVEPNPFLTNCFIKIKSITQSEAKPIGEKIVEMNVDNMVNEIMNSKIDTIKTEPECDESEMIKETPILEDVNLETLDIDFIDINTEPLKEMSLDTLSLEPENPIKLSTDDDFYKKYLIAKKEAKEAKQKAILAYLNLDEIKKKYNIDEESDEEN